MPINRPDGRHWCAPEREPIPDSGVWVCSDCAKVWEFRGSTWAPEGAFALSPEEEVEVDG
jgi:ribosomal protein L37AE/L43A